MSAVTSAVSSARRRTSSARSARTARARCCGGTARQPGCAARAASTAARTSAAPESGTSAATSPLAGSTSSSVSTPSAVAPLAADVVVEPASDPRRAVALWLLIGARHPRRHRHRLLLGPHRRHLFGAALLPGGEAHRRDGDDEEHHRDHVDFDRDPALGGAEDVEREGHRRPRVEVGDHEVVDREREGEHRAAEDPGHDQRQGDEAEGLERRRPEVLRRLLEVAVEPDQARADDDDDEADAEHDVGDQQRLEPEWGLPRIRKNESSAAPITTSGVAIGITIRKLAGGGRRTGGGPAPAPSSSRSMSRSPSPAPPA